jgi:hypothetical protein
MLPTRDTTVPPRESWPESPPQTEAGARLTDVILTTFRLNARLLEAAQVVAANGGLTAAWCGRCWAASWIIQNHFRTSSV